MSFFSSERLDEKHYGRNKIKFLKEKNDEIIVIHYSCESFFNLHGRTPRITSIGVKHRGNNSSKAFSIHLQAQIHKKDIATLTPSEYDFLEKEMLKEFYAYIKKHGTYNWVHWNMKNANYGFEAISNRSRILGIKPIDIEDKFKFDLSDILGYIYTYKFEDDKPLGKMLNLADRNQISTSDALNGKAEAEAFDNKKYLNLNMSTMRKVEIIDRILSLTEKDKLKVNIQPIDHYGLSLQGIIEITQNNKLLLLVWSIVIFIAGAALEPVIQDFFN